MKRVYRITGTSNVKKETDFLFSLTEMLVEEETASDYKLLDTETGLVYYTSKQEVYDHFQRGVLFSNVHYEQVIYTSSILAAEEFLIKQWDAYSASLDLKEDLYRKMKNYIKSRNFENTFAKLEQKIVAHLTRMDHRLGENRPKVGIEYQLEYNHRGHNKLDVYFRLLRNSSALHLNRVDDLTLSQLKSSSVAYGELQVEFSICVNDLTPDTILEKIKPITTIFKEEIVKMIRTHEIKRNVLSNPFDFKYVDQKYLD